MQRYPKSNFHNIIFTVRYTIMYNKFCIYESGSKTVGHAGSWQCAIYKRCQFNEKQKEGKRILNLKK